MHQASETFALTLPNALAPHLLNTLYEKVSSKLDEFGDGLSHEIAQELEQLQQWPHLALPRGVIHADIFPDNVFFIDDTLSGVIDFYFACEDYFAFDLAICFNAWCFDREGNACFNEDKARALLQGYHAQRSLSDEEWDVFSLLARGAAMRFLLTRAVDWFYQVDGAVVIPHNPAEYVKKWRFHLQPRDYREYLR